MSVFVPTSYCLDNYNFIVESKVWDCDASCFGFLFQHYLAICGLLWFHTNFRILCSGSVKNVFDVLTGIALNV